MGTIIWEETAYHTESMKELGKIVRTLFKEGINVTIYPMKYRKRIIWICCTEVNSEKAYELAAKYPEVLSGWLPASKENVNEWRNYLS